MKRAASILAIVLIVAAYVWGFWPQYRKAQAARAQLAAVSAALSHAQEQVRLCRLQNDLQAVIRQTAEKNYGTASQLSSGFFSAVVAELPRQSDPNVDAALQSVLQQRDAVTAALAKGDPNSLSLLQPLEDNMTKIVAQSLGGSGSQQG